ncbi:uncharacterized protein [Euwallacea fornicatus]|uniref:uncharacterized protein n=1 Tax=Euwallacea fornicatus TaxID=995702 RepID=UPI00338F430E
MAFPLIYVSALAFLMYHRCDLLLQPQESSSKITIRCINQLAGMLLPDNHQVVLTNFEGFLYKRAPLVRVSNRGTVKCFRRCPEVDAYILDFQKVNISNLLRNLESNRICNPSSFFIARISSVANVDFALFAEKYIEKILLVDAKRDIHTYHPYKYENLRDPYLQPHKYGSCDELHLKPKINLLMSKPKYWRNTTFSAILRVTPPYVVGNGTGLEELMLKYIKSVLKTHIVVEYVHFENTTIPYRREKRKIRERKRDIFGGHVMPLEDDIGKFEISPAYLYDQMVFISPKPLDVHLWKRVFPLFPNTFWFFLSIAICTSSLVTKKFYNIYVLQSVLVYAQILMGVPVGLMKTDQTPLRVLFAAWLLFFTILSTVFKNVLILMSVTTLKSKGINTIEEVAASKLPIYSMGDMKLYFTSPSQQQLINWGVVHKCNNYMMCVDNVAKYQSSIAIGGLEIMSMHIIPLLYVRDNEIMLHLSKNAIFGFPIQLVYTKGHPIHEQLSKIIQRGVANGWMQQKIRIQKHLLILKTFHKYRIRSKVILLRDLNYSFGLWAGGCVVSGTVFFGEYLVWHFQRKIRVNAGPTRKSVGI